MKSKPSIHLIRGLAVHQAIAQFTKSHSTGDCRSENNRQVLLELFDDSWHRQKSAIDRLQLSRNEIGTYYSESRQMLSNWLKRYVSGDLKSPTVEVRLFSRRHRLLGVIDAIFSQSGTVTLVDYKTSAKAEITQDIKVQMAIYALLYKENFGTVPHYVAVDFLKPGFTQHFRVTEQLTHTAADLCARIHKATQSTDERHYPCRCGGWCDKDFIL
jgi:ATP-dependent exoDNAse (exonuclease V) beta subunit